MPVVWMKYASFQVYRAMNVGVQARNSNQMAMKFQLTFKKWFFYMSDRLDFWSKLMDASVLGVQSSDKKTFYRVSSEINCKEMVYDSHNLGRKGLLVFCTAQQYNGIVLIPSNSTFSCQIWNTEHISKF